MLRPQNTQIGPGSLAGLAALVARLNPRNAMLVTGGNAYRHSGAHHVVEPALGRATVYHFDGVAPNPTIADVARGVSLWRRERPDIIVAAGGGSVLDVAKLVGLLGPGAESWGDYLDRPEDLDSAGVPVIAIPTTAGSGAEATRFATFYVAGEKRSISHPLLRPRHVFVDPLLTASVPPDLAAVTAFDALAQAIESLWAVGATPGSRMRAEAALREILPCLGHIGRAPALALRARMAHGAHLAGQAIDLSRTTAAHALSYALTADLGVAHGHAVALLLPSIMRINDRPEGRRIVHPRGAAYLAATMRRMVRLLHCKDGEEASCLLQRHAADVGLSAHLTVAAPSVSAASLAAKVNADRLSNNPVALSADDVLAIYAGLLEGRA
jgi:alcohol dehydrogenase class IV